MGLLLAALAACGVATAAPAPQARAASPPAATIRSGIVGDHRIVIVPMTWSARPSTVDELTTAQLARLGRGLDSYYRAVTGGRVRVSSVKILPWRRVAVRSRGCAVPAEALMRAARAAAGRLPADGRSHVVAYLPADHDCTGWDGLAGLGTPGGVGVIWLQGPPTLTTLAHEFAHNLGAEHSGALVCGRSALITWAPRCERETYADPWDLMGGGGPEDETGHPGIGHLHRLGLLPRGALTTVRGTRTVRLSPFAAARGLRGATFRVGTKTFFVEYRAPVGVDAWIATYHNPAGTTPALPLQGVVVREVDAASPPAYRGEQSVLDFHPSAADDASHGPALYPGESYRTPGGAWSIAVTSADATGATIRLVTPRR